MKRLNIVFAVLILLPFLGISQSLEELNKPIVAGLDEVAPFSEGLAAVRKGNQWGFMDKEGTLVIDFRDDVVWNQNADTTQADVSGVRYPQFKQGLSIIQELTDEGVPLYGFMDTSGKQVIKPEFVNISSFDNGYAIAIYGKKTLRGKNEFQLNIYDYSFTEVLINLKGEMLWPIQERDNILMSKNRYQLPQLNTKILSDDLLAVKGKDNQWKVVKMALNDPR